MSRTVPARCLFITALLVVAASSLAQQSGDETPRTETRDLGSYVDLALVGGVSIPLEFTPQRLFRVGGVTDLHVALRLPGIAWLAPSAVAGYGLTPVRANTSISTAVVGGGVQFLPNLQERLSLTIGLYGGMHYATFNETQYEDAFSEFPEQSGISGYASGAVGLSFLVSPWLSISANAQYRANIGLNHLAVAGLSATVNPGGIRRRVLIRDIELTPVFPSLRNYYGSGTEIGRLQIRNEERFTISNVHVSLFVPGYMSQPVPGEIADSLAPGATAQCSLRAIFSDPILEVTETRTVAATATVAYELNGRTYETTAAGTLRVHNRNAITWTDDQKVAAFIDATDPDVRRLATQISTIVTDHQVHVIDRNLQTALALFTGLRTAGMEYVIDPNTPDHETASRDANVVDYVQFARETLQLRGGDCDDLSILYATALESIGTPAALITIPGHIYVAVGLDVDPARRDQTVPDRLAVIEHGGRLWVPLEVTAVRSSFMEAWRIGAEEWSRYRDNESTQFLPVRESWRVYPPVQPSSSDHRVAMPLREEHAERYARELRALARELVQSEVDALVEAIDRSANPVRHQNRLGVLYARYGMYDEAEGVFGSIVAETKYGPAVVNLANLRYRQGRLYDALDLYRQALALHPDSPDLLLMTARVAYEAGEYEEAEALANRIAERYPDRLESHPYLTSSDADGERAAVPEDIQGQVRWVEE